MNADADAEDVVRETALAVFLHLTDVDAISLADRIADRLDVEIGLTSSGRNIARAAVLHAWNDIMGGAELAAMLASPGSST